MKRDKSFSLIRSLSDPRLFLGIILVFGLYEIISLVFGRQHALSPDKTYYHWLQVSIEIFLFLLCILASLTVIAIYSINGNKSSSVVSNEDPIFNISIKDARSPDADMVEISGALRHSDLSIFYFLIPYLVCHVGIISLFSYSKFGFYSIWEVTSSSLSSHAAAFPRAHTEIDALYYFSLSLNAVVAFLSILLLNKFYERVNFRYFKIKLLRKDVTK